MKSNNIADELNGCLVINEVIGIQYFSLKRSLKENFQEKTTVVQKFGFLVYLVAFLVLGVVVVKKTALEEKISSQNVLSRIYQMVNSYSFFVFIITSLIQSYATTNHLKKFFKNTKDLADWSSTEFDKNMNFAVFRKTFVKWFLSINLLYLTALGGLVCKITSSVSESVPMFIFGIFSSFVLLNVFKFFFYVCFINFQLEHVEKLLQSTFQPQRGQKIGKIFILKVKEKFEIPANCVMHQLLVVWKMYNKIRDNASLVNKSTGLTMMFALVNSIMTFIYSGYELTIGAISGHSESFESTYLSFSIKKNLF